MNGYLLFAGNCYYPLGGAEDLSGRFDSVDAAKAAHAAKDMSRYGYLGGWANVLDLETLQVVSFYSSEKWRDVTGGVA